MKSKGSASNERRHSERDVSRALLVEGSSHTHSRHGSTGGLPDQSGSHKSERSLTRSGSLNRSSRIVVLPLAVCGSMRPLASSKWSGQRSRLG